MNGLANRRCRRSVVPEVRELFLLRQEQYECFVKVIIDWANCTSCGTCSDTCPLLFEQNPEDTFSQIIEKIPAQWQHFRRFALGELESCAREAEDLCPVQIIRIEE